jgi:rubrerythrin
MKEFCRLLDEAIKDEEEAPEMYSKLQDALPLTDDLTLEVLEKIKTDEGSHLNLLKTIKRNVCSTEK